MPPGLLGQTPGWPTTDLIVINDNNKAQRNMSVHYGLSGIGSKHYAIVRNGSMKPRDFVLRLLVADAALRGFKAPQVLAQGGEKAVPLEKETSLVIEGMEPGEARWVEFDMAAFKAKVGTALPIDFQEVVDGQVVNGYRISIQAASTQQAVHEVALFNKAVFQRLLSGLKVREAGRVIKASAALAVRKSLTLDDYLSFMASVRDPMTISVKRYVESERDTGLDTTTALEQLLAALGTRSGRTTFANHVTLLNKVDVGLTLLFARG